MTTATTFPLSDLRVISDARGNDIGLDRAYHGSRTFDGFLLAIACPVCGCTKSGDLATANTITEACDFSRCRCHTACGICEEPVEKPGAAFCNDCWRYECAHGDGQVGRVAFSLYWCRSCEQYLGLALDGDGRPEWNALGATL